MKKILIIEDNTQLQEILHRKLTERAYEVIPAPDGKTGLSLVKTFMPDLIVLDIMLPGGLNGFDVLEALQKDPTVKKIPVMILTNLDAQAKNAKSYRVVDYMVKTDLSLNDVVTRIERALTT